MPNNVCVCDLTHAHGVCFFICMQGAYGIPVKYMNSLQHAGLAQRTGDQRARPGQCCDNWGYTFTL